MTETATHSPAIEEEDRLRADLYNFLGLLLAAPPGQLLLDQAAGLGGDASELGQAIAGLARVAKVTKPAAAEREFNALFIGLGRGELLPYASYYLTGFLNEKPLAQLRGDMAARGITRAGNVYEPEDNIASLMEMMDYEDLAQVIAQSGPEFGEGLDALKEKRKPDYQAAAKAAGFSDGMPSSEE